MRKIIFAVFSILLLTVIIFYFIFEKDSSNYEFEKGWDERIESALAEIDCPEVVERKYAEGYYSGKLIDTHIHIANIPDSDIGSEIEISDKPLLGENVWIDDFVCMIKSEGTAKVFAFFPVYPEIPDQMIEVVFLAMQKYPNFFVPFIMPPDHDDRLGGFPTVDVVKLEEMLSVRPDLFKGYGEIGLYEREGGAAALPPDSERLREIYPVVRENNLVVYFHLGEGQQESFEKILDENPDINFIWHGDQLISEENGEQNLEKIDEILTNHPNAFYGIDELYGDVWLLRPEVSKEEFLAHFENYEPLLEEDVKTWEEFIERHPDQVLWGTDRGWSAPWSLDVEVGLVLTDYSRAFIGKLDPSVQEKFAYKNAEKLFE